jgi:5-methylcytosine-specific restriction enzyme subunit McrC
MPQRPRRITVSEYGRIERTELDASTWAALQRFDEHHARRAGGDTVFDWSLLAAVRARNWVGVVEVPGAAIEILPKVEPGQAAVSALAAKNLITMLEVAGALPPVDRAYASLDTQASSLLDALVLAFATRLLAELERGPHRAYVRREENLRVLRGKLLVGRDAVANRGLLSRVYVEYDELVADAPLNRVLRAACELLVRRVRSSVAVELLDRALLHLAEVASVRVGQAELAAVHFDRTNERFRDLFVFARMVLASRAPTHRFGDERTFSLLFPMEQVFEAYVARMLARHAGDLGLGDARVRAQAGGRYLAEDLHGKGFAALRPDVLIETPAGQPIALLDTKWKALIADAEDRSNGLSRADLYQLYAYATRFACPQSVLLYPRVAGVGQRRLRVPGTNHELRVELLDLGRDLRKERAAVVADLAAILGGRPGLGVAPGVAVEAG